MPREHVPNFPAARPDGHVEFCHSIQPGARVVTVQLVRPAFPVANAVWFVYFEKPPANDGRDPYTFAGKTVIQGAAGAAFRHYVFTRQIRALIFLPTRAIDSLYGLVQATGRTSAPRTWQVRTLADGQMRKDIFVRHQESFKPARWAVFDTTPAWASLMSGDVCALPGLDAAVFGEFDGICRPRFPVRFGPMTVDPRVLAARKKMYADNILTCVHGQGGTVLPELDADSRTAWVNALKAIRASTLVVGPVWMLALLCRYVASMLNPAMAARLIDLRVRGQIVPLAAELAPDEILPQLEYAYWKDVPEL